MIEIRVVPDEGDAYEVTVTSRDILAWERVTKGMTFQRLQNDMNMTHMYNLAHRASVRKRLFSGTLEDFEASHDLDLLEAEDSADPTNTGA